MITIEKSIVVDAPVEQVFAYLSDPAHGPEYGTGEVEDVQPLPNGGYRYTEVDKFLGLRVETANEDVEVVPNERVVTKFQSAVMDGTASMRFERLESGKTRLSCAAEASIHGGALAKFGESFLAKYFGHEMEMGQEAMKARIEAKTPAATPS